MPIYHPRLPIYLPKWLHGVIRGLIRPKDASPVPEAQIPNLVGDRDIEWSWIASKIPTNDGQALDFGWGGSNIPFIAALMGFHVTAIDLAMYQLSYSHPRLCFIQGDLLELTFPEAHFDLIINCSTVEHVGLVGRYGVNESRQDGDLEAMKRLRQLLKPDGLMLMTIPVGQDYVAAPLHRIYGSSRLPGLLEGFTVEEELYWGKDNENRWIPCDRSQALAIEIKVDYVNLQNNFYGLGCFTLRRAG